MTVDAEMVNGSRASQLSPDISLSFFVNSLKILGEETMPFNETKRPSDAHSNHPEQRTKPAPLDLLRLTSSQQSKDTSSATSSAQDKGKGPASQEKNERAVGENGKPLEKLKLASVSTPEHPILPGGMRRGGDQASTSRSIRAEDFARMPASEQVDWCLRGGIAKAFGPDGDRTLVSSAIQMLRNEQIDSDARFGIIKVIGSLGDRREVPEMMQMLHNEQTNEFVRGYIAKAIGSLGDRTVLPEMM
jgi:hypothetical protein